MTFGTALHEARERRGLDLNTAATRLRLRPDILRAIEEDDLSRLPPRGYTKNMVNAYARLVGLNPTDITQMYLDADYAFRAGNARSSSARGGRGSSRSFEGSSARSGGRENSFGRIMYDDRKEYSHTRDFEGGRSERIYAGEKPRQSRHNALNSQYTNFYAGPRADGGIMSRLPLIAAGVVILVLLIIVLSLALGGGGNNNEEAETQKVPITGIDDTTGTEDGSAAEPVKPTLTAPESVTVTYKIADDTEVYAVITNDGVTEAPLFSGGEEEEIEVSGVWSFGAWASDAVTITVDGEPVAFNTTDESGMPVCVVDFESWLDGWYEDHPDVKRESKSADDKDEADAADGQSGDAAASDGTGTSAAGTGGAPSTDAAGTDASAGAADASAGAAAGGTDASAAGTAGAASTDGTGAAVGAAGGEVAA
ncbi:helix-turn-helix domain-containing protein [Eggerthellaceae bacterium zg-886]|uniref:Helix-turn-helix domain-containing protein n=1 Tax=Xiamenia xianingshaonis TaxID=2682776 RepID=A0A9E6SV53_9ACTN|nr:helix-turn-helix domain-containing protein [Xiamenia xianingshaonis]QTU85195.1 helix-turn-helix domain-containing protein [Xiamenia xianingshaonis]